MIDRCKSSEDMLRIEIKTENIIKALTKNYIKDGYHVNEYNNNQFLGFIEVVLQKDSKNIRITSMIINKEIMVFKNNKFNNKIEII